MSSDVRRGQSSARSVSEKLLNLSTERRRPTFGAHRSEEPNGTAPSADLDELVRSAATSTHQLRRQSGQLIDFLAEQTKAALRALPIGPVSGGDDGQAVAVGPVAAGAVGVGRLWLHDWTGSGRPSFSGTSLVSHDGAVIAAECVEIDAEGPTVDYPGTAVPLLVRVTVSPQASPGVYRGTLVVLDHPSGWLSLEVEVEHPGTETASD